MLNIIMPNRFYQIEYVDRCSDKVTRAIDLKHIKQIMLIEGTNREGKV